MNVNIKKMICHIGGGGCLGWARRGLVHELPLVGFHSVGQESKAFLQHLSFSREAFEKRIAYLAKWYTSIFFSDIASCAKTVRNPIIIYFDDGYYDNLEFGLPILEKYNMKATIFLSTRGLESGCTIWPLRIRSALHCVDFATFKSVCDYLSLDPCVQYDANAVVTQIKMRSSRQCIDYIEGLLTNYYQNLRIRMIGKDDIINASSLIRFSSHTHNHLDLRGCNLEALEHEFSKSKSILSGIGLDHIDSSVVSLPFGRCNARVIQTAENYDYQYVVSGERGLNALPITSSMSSLLKQVHASSDECFKIWQLRLAGVN